MPDDRRHAERDQSCRGGEEDDQAGGGEDAGHWREIRRQDLDREERHCGEELERCAGGRGGAAAAPGGECEGSGG